MIQRRHFAELTEKQQERLVGWMWKGMSPHRFFLKFSSKNSGFYAFYCEKLLVARNRDRGFNRPPAGEGGAKCIKGTGWKFSRGSNSPKSPLARTLINSDIHRWSRVVSWLLWWVAMTTGVISYSSNDWRSSCYTSAASTGTASVRCVAISTSTNCDDATPRNLLVWCHHQPSLSAVAYNNGSKTVTAYSTQATMPVGLWP